MEQFSEQLTSPEQADWQKRFIDRAGEYWTQFVVDRPQDRWQLAFFWARQGRIDQALNLLERIWRDAPPAGLAQLFLAVMDRDSLTETQSQRMEKIMADALVEHDRPATLLVRLATVRDRQQRYDDSEALYRECLEKYQNDVAAMNNLAVLLANRKIKLDEAERLVEKAIKIAGPIGALLDSRATVRMARGRMAQAISDLQLAVVDKATPLRYFHLAQAYFQDGKRAEATQAIKKAIALGLDPDDLHPLEGPAYDRLKGLLK
jgi:tetratricopeptide (TPR) repeat protein